MTTKNTNLVLLDTDGNEHWLISVSAEQAVTARAGLHFIWARDTGNCVSVHVDDLQLTPASLEKVSAVAKKATVTGLTVRHGGAPICAKAVMIFELHQLTTMVRTLFIDGDVLKGGMHFKNYADASGFCRNVIKPHADMMLQRLNYLSGIALDLLDAPPKKPVLQRVPQQREAKR